MRGTPRTMQHLTDYDDVVRDVARELRTRVDSALAAGIARDGLLADPGLGFAKTLEHNVALLRALPELASTTGVPMVVGTSRKSFLARLAGDEGRDDATLATTVWSFEHGAGVVRVHDVAASARAVALLDVLERATPEGMAA
jgi:dihydropteroate synthase